MINQIFKGKTRATILRNLKNLGLTQDEAISFMDMLPKEILNQLSNEKN